MTVTFVAFGPLGPLSASKVTFAPSASVLKPLPEMLLWCTNRSLPWSSGVMKPKPFSSLNHLTVPVAMMILRVLVLRNAEDADGQRLRPLALLGVGRLSNSNAHSVVQERSFAPVP